MIKRCVPEDEMHSIMDHCHTLPCGGHFGRQRTEAKVLQSGFYWPSLFKDAHRFVSTCDKCQRMGNISRKDEPPMHRILEVDDELKSHLFLIHFSVLFSVIFE